MPQVGRDPPGTGGHTHPYLQTVLAGHGLDPARVDLVARTDRAGYLRRLADLDVALDPFPFGGVTTTCDALWQGVPVVGLLGDRYGSRPAAALLPPVGLGDLVAGHADGYVRAAAGLAGEVPRLAAVRRSCGTGCGRARCATAGGTPASWPMRTGPCGGRGAAGDGRV